MEAPSSSFSAPTPVSYQLEEAPTITTQEPDNHSEQAIEPSGIIAKAVGLFQRIFCLKKPYPTPQQKPSQPLALERLPAPQGCRYLESGLVGFDPAEVQPQILTTQFFLERYEKASDSKSALEVHHSAQNSESPAPLTTQEKLSGSESSHPKAQQVEPNSNLTPPLGPTEKQSTESLPLATPHGPSGLKPPSPMTPHGNGPSQEAFSTPRPIENQQTQPEITTTTREQPTDSKTTPPLPLHGPANSESTPLKTAHGLSEETSSGPQSVETHLTLVQINPENLLELCQIIESNKNYDLTTNDGKRVVLTKNDLGDVTIRTQKSSLPTPLDADNNPGLQSSKLDREGGLRQKSSTNIITEFFTKVITSALTTNLQESKQLIPKLPPPPLKQQRAISAPGLLQKKTTKTSQLIEDRAIQFET